MKPGRLAVAKRFVEPAIDAARAHGHRMLLEPPWSLGRVCAVGPRDGFVAAAGTPRIQVHALAR